MDALLQQKIKEVVILIEWMFTQKHGTIVPLPVVSLNLNQKKVFNIIKVMFILLNFINAIYKDVIFIPKIR